MHQYLVAAACFAALAIALTLHDCARLRARHATKDSLYDQ